MGPAIFYFLLGSLFTYFAITNGSNGVWNFRTLLPATIAAFDFGMAIKYFRLFLRLQKKD